ncbi:MAG: hypothetical protein WD604_17970 [Balneolaceae bacterium]
MHSFRYNQICCCFFLILIPLLWFSPAAKAQTDPPRATLKGWADYNNLFIKDRAHNTGGYYYDRGLFRWYTHEMGPEYDGDIFAMRFTLFDDYKWAQTENGYRTAFGSINTPDFSVIGSLKNQVDVSNKGFFTIEATQQEDRRAQRVLFNLGYTHRFNNLHRAGFKHTLSQRKTDIDATLFYRYGNRNRGTVTAEFTFLDWFNNIASDLALHRKSDYEVRHVYSKQPYLYSLQLESPRIGIFRGEAVASIQPQSTARVNRKDAAEEDFILHDWVNYQGALLEFALKGVTGGVIYQRTFAKMERGPAENSEYELDYGNRQLQTRWGFYGAYQWKKLGFEQWFWIERNRDQQIDHNPGAYRQQDPYAGSRYPFDFNEVHRWNKTRLYFDPGDKGLTAYLEHNGDWRDLAAGRDLADEFKAYNYRIYYDNHIETRNERFTFSLGYRFSENFYFLLGASIDIDGDVINGFDQQRGEGVVSRFDGGFTRMVLSW